MNLRAYVRVPATRRFVIPLFAIALGSVVPAPVSAATPMSFSKTVVPLIPTFSVPQADAVADFDHAHGLDIAVMGHHGDIAILLNQGNGTFAAPQYVDSPCGIATSIAAGQFSADANPDLLVACDNNVLDGFKRLRGNGDGTFADPDTLAPIEPHNGGGGTIERLQLGAFGGEGQALTFIQFFGGGNGVELLCFFRLPDLIADFDGAGTFLPRCSRDWDPSDNLIDLLQINGPYTLATPPFSWPDQAGFGFLPDGNLGAMLYSPGDPQLLAGFDVEEYSCPHPIAGAEVQAAGDLDSDGVPEIVALTGQHEFAVYTVEPSQPISPGFRQIADPEIVATTAAHGFPSDVVVADFDGDGKRDVAVLTDTGDGDTGTIEIHPGKGDGTFGSSESFATDSTDGRLTIADLDGVGLPDLVNLNRSSSVVTIQLNTTLVGNTPIGSNVLVSPDADVRVTFADVSAPGLTTAISSATGSALPTGFKVAGSYWEISTTASYAPPVEVCIAAPGVADPHLFHAVGGVFVDVTTRLDPPFVCGAVSTLSPFVVGNNPAATAARARCRAAIGKNANAFAQAKLKLLQACHEALIKKGLSAATCPDADGKIAGKIASIGAKANAAIVKACAGKDKVCGTGNDDVTPAAVGFPATCPGFEGSTSGTCGSTIDDCGGIGPCLNDCIGEHAVDQAIGLYYGSLEPSDPKNAKALNKCQLAIGKSAAALFAAESKAIQKCWDTVNKGKASGPCPPFGTDAKADTAIAKAKQKYDDTTCKACGTGKPCDINGRFARADVGFAQACPPVVQPGLNGHTCDFGRNLSTMEDIRDCVECVTEFKVDCLTAAAASGVGSAPVPYPTECNVILPPT